MNLQNTRRIKVVLLGNYGVGKSSLVRRFDSDTINPSLASNSGAQFGLKSASIAGEQVRLEVWDTAGQERYRNLSPVYFLGASVAILVYNINDRQSFKDLDKWKALLPSKSENKSMITMLVGSKSDQAAEKREVVYEEGAAYASKEGMAGFMEVSALTGEGMDRLFTESMRHWQQCVE